MRRTSINFVVVASLFLAISATAAAQQRQERRSSTKPSGEEHQRVSEKRSNSTQAENDSTHTKTPKAPSASLFRETCYKPGTLIPVPVQASFSASSFKWSQPNGLGSAITLTYSYSNLLGGTIKNVSDDVLRSATEEALSVWSSYVPIHFVEVKDSGPLPTQTESSYSASTYPNIRFGAHTIDGSTGGELAHAYFPFSTNDGLAGDLHLDKDEDWTQVNGGYLLEVLLHELGHALGLNHVDNISAIMYPYVQDRYTRLGQAELFVDDIDGVQFIYGAGEGSVEPLEVTEPEPPATVPGDVQVVFDDVSGLITITGDANNNELVVVSNFCFAAVVGLNDTTINGSSYVTFMSMLNKSVKADLAGGDDIVVLWGAKLKDANLLLGDGKDLVALIFSRVTSLVLDGGTGENQLFRFFDRIDSETVTGF